MEDEELTKIRNQRMAQLRMQQQRHPASAAASGSRGNVQGGGDNNDMEAQKKAQERENEMRNTILSSVLSQEARARLSTFAVAKPDRAKVVENIIIQNVQMGAIRGKVDEDQLKDLLEKVMSTKRETNVKYERRRVFDDDDDDDNDDDDQPRRRKDDSDDDSD